MLFNTLTFAVFFSVVLAVYFLLPDKYRWAFLLVASYYFYMSWKAEYVVLILASTVVDYVAARYMAGRRERARSYALAFSLVFNLGILAAFKYWNFFSEATSETLGLLGISSFWPTFDVLLPVGISFYTFQTLSYTIDVYRGERDPERHFGKFALYVSFFPQLVAGPIERSLHLLPQFSEPHAFDFDRIRRGLSLILWGLFKKMVIADRLGHLVSEVYDSPFELGGLQILVATYFFAFQIYCDFSGYTDIAIGSAKVLGYDLMENFRRPYFSASIRDFWRRWHISLSTWFRDYLYVPLGGNRVGGMRHYLNLWVVFLLCGLWHGANWTFVVWGALHGIYLTVGSLIAGRTIVDGERDVFAAGFAEFFRTVATFHLVVFAWVFFRSSSVEHAIGMIWRMLSDISSAGPLWDADPVELILGIALIGFLLLVEYAQGRIGSIQLWLERQPTALRWAVYYAGLFSILFLGAQPSEFIYFQF